MNTHSSAEELLFTQSFQKQCIKVLCSLFILFAVVGHDEMHEPHLSPHYRCTTYSQFPIQSYTKIHSVTISGHSQTVLGHLMSLCMSLSVLLVHYCMQQSANTKISVSRL